MEKIQNYYLLGISFIYLFAFSSIYIQIPGLYGESGLLPVEHFIKSQKIDFGIPYIKIISDYLNFESSQILELVSFCGIILALGSCLIQQLRNMITYFVLWILYYSIYQVGQTFLWFQWDMLLLESGFLTIFVAPIIYTKYKIQSKKLKSNNDLSFKLKFWLIKWLCFRLMFASGLVKLSSKCPVWWGLDAMNWHYESQCIPTSLAWYTHQFPNWLQRFSVVATLVIEVAFPFLFFSPIRIHRLIAGYAQIFLMFLILVTGNFNFFNVHIMVLHLCLADDKHMGNQKPEDGYRRNENLLERIVKIVINFALLYGLISYCVKFFDLKLYFTATTFAVTSKINFTEKEFFDWLAEWMPITIWIGACSLLYEICQYIWNVIKYMTGRKLHIKIWTLLKATFVTNLVIYLFVISVVPFYDLDYRNGQRYLWPITKVWYSKIRDFRIANSYGLFRSMTGVGGRPEIIILGSDNPNHGWKEFDFFYKIGNLSKSPPYLVPHQPRLDWQMWFAALDSYQNNPWLVNLLYKILMDDKNVLALMGPQKFFKDKPPKYIKVDLYLYHFTNNKNLSNWWWREKLHEYFPPVTKETPELLKYLKQLGFLPEKGGYVRKGDRSSNEHLKKLILSIRKYVTETHKELKQPHRFVWSLTLPPLLLNFFYGRF